MIAGMATEIVQFVVEGEDRAELDRLVDHFGEGDRAAFLREVIRVMADRERAERRLYQT